MVQQNFLLGKGERLTSNIIMNLGGSPKQAPYTFSEARGRLAPMVAHAATEIDGLPPEACPGDQAIISLTLNPEYIAKSYFPSKLLHDVGMDVVGSRPRRITPQKRSRGREAVETLTTELFAKGQRSVIRAWSASLPDWQADRWGASDLISIEEIRAPAPSGKIKGPLPDFGRFSLETVLHASELEAKTDMLRAFAVYLEWRGIEAEFGRRFFCEGPLFFANRCARRTCRRNRRVHRGTGTSENA